MAVGGVKLHFEKKYQRNYNDLLDWILTLSNIVQLAGAVEYTDCISAKGQDPLAPMRVLDMTLNNLVVKFQ